METWTTFQKVLKAIKDNPHPSKKSTININNVFSNRKEFEPIKKSVESIFHSKKYHNSTYSDFLYTLRYCFFIMKKFIFVQIRNNKVITFAHVENMDFTNNFSSHIKVSALTLKRKLKTFQKDTYKCKPKKIEEDKTKWIATDYFVFPYINEGISDQHYEKEFYDMLSQCSNTYKIPDIDLIINKKDANFLTWDDTYPYNVYKAGKDGNQIHRTFYPILSIGTTVRHADIPIPYPQDWIFKIQSLSSWSQRVSKAVFRGAATGSGTTKNPRIIAALLSIKWKKEGKDILDAGITNESCRLRITDDKNLDWIKLRKWNIPISQFLSREEQSKFKYILHIDGNIAAFRLSEDLASGSVVLKVSGDNEVWFSKLLVENVHYISINRDLSNLEEKIQWCKDNDTQCQEIAKNAYNLVKNTITQKRILQYWKYIIDMCSNVK